MRSPLLFAPATRPRKDRANTRQMLAMEQDFFNDVEEEPALYLDEFPEDYDPFDDPLPF